MKYKMTFMGLLVLIAAANVTNAQPVSDREFGLGLMVGEPTGVSFKYWFDEERAVDGAFAWALSEDDGFQLHADYLFHDYQLSNSEEWPVYYGLGALLLFKHDEGRHHDDDKTVFGFRVPVGISYLFEDDTPWEFFFEIAPILEIAPDVDLNLNASVGLRFYF